MAGLYVKPPESAVVLAVDEKPSIQAPQRRGPTDVPCHPTGRRATLPSNSAPVSIRFGAVTCAPNFLIIPNT